MLNAPHSPAVYAQLTDQGLGPSTVLPSFRVRGRDAQGVEPLTPRSLFFTCLLLTLVLPLV